MQTKTETIGVFITEHGIKMDGVLEKVKNNEPVAAQLTYYHAGVEIQGWIQIGTARITITFDSPEKVIAEQIEQLRNEIAFAREAAETRVQSLNEKIQSLLALPCDSTLILADGEPS